MNNKTTSYFSKGELLLWFSSTMVILISFFLFDRENYLTLTASFIGAASLIFCAKGNPFGQFLMVVFSAFYGIISFSFSYYGEMITYLGMTAPMAVFSLFSWLHNPYHGNRSQVKIRRLKKIEWIGLAILTSAVTFVFYFILDAVHTANLLPSTISVATSFLAVSLTFLRSPFYAAAYAANDLVLILLWTFAAFKDSSYISVVLCFVIFLGNDIYGFLNWSRMEKQQNSC